MKMLLLLKRWFEKKSEAIWLIAAIGVPLIFYPWGYNGFELPKAALLRALVLLAAPLVLVQFIERTTGLSRGKKRCLRLLLWSVLAFGLAQLVAVALSVNPRTSFWGSYERQQGWITIVAYLTLFFLTAIGLCTRAQIERLWATLVWPSGPVVFYGFLQALGLDPFEWQTDGASLVLSTIGRANFLGSYLVLVIPLTVGWTLQASHRWYGWLLLVAQVVCLTLTQARGAWLGMGVAALTFALAWAAVTRRRWSAATALVLAGLAVGFVVLLNVPGGPLTPLIHLPGLDRLAALTRTDAGSTAARLTIWRATLPLVAKKPWLGYGPETMGTVFARVFPPQLVYYQGRGFTVDRAHNLWLDLGMSGGLASIVAFCAILIGFGWLAWQGLRKEADRWKRVAWAALGAAVAGHVVDLQFSFDLTASATVFWLVLALGAALGRERGPMEKAAMGDGEDAWFYLLPSLAVLALIWLVCLRPLLADAAFQQSRLETRPYMERLEAGRRAIHLWSLEPEYHYGLAWVLTQAGDFRAAETALDAAAQLNSGDPRLWMARGELYAAWGTVEPGRYVSAEVAYRQALELAPNVATVHAALGWVLGQQGRLEEGMIALERAVALDATNGAAYSYLADLYRALGREEEAERAQREAMRWRKNND